jgi:hypothetical protein
MMALVDQINNRKEGWQEGSSKGYGYEKGLVNDEINQYVLLSVQDDTLNMC